MGIVETNAFQLSRVYGEGWRAAKKSLAGDHAEGAARVVTLNPYRDLEEKARWAKGFEDGLVSRTGPHNAGHGSGWRPSPKQD